MKQLVMTKGLPASGKTTWAKEQIAQFPAGQVVRVNKDDLRAMLHDSGFDRQRTEPFVVATRDQIIAAALADEHVRMVIVDDTNFGRKHEPRLRQLAERHKAEFIVHDFTDVDVAECIRRDLKRPNSVGHKVIRRMHLQFIGTQYEPPVYDEGLPDAVIVDIDGTLAHMTGRSPYDYDRVSKDTVDDLVRDLVLTRADRGDYVLLVSGRPDSCRDATIEWLQNVGGMFYGEAHQKLFMRATGDNRPDDIVKAELYERHIAGRFNVRFVLDDRDRVVAMWRSRGLQTLQVADGDF